MKNQKKNLWKWLIKVFFSGLAIWWVSQKINFGDAFQLLNQISPVYIVVSIVFFNLSKIVSAYRLTTYFNNIGLTLDNSYNTALYYKGMFYNLFLPGGIGGDGYKIFVLNSQFKTPVKLLFQAILFDRISGMGALVFILLGSLLLTLYTKASFFILLGTAIATLVLYPGYYLIVFLFGKSFIGSIIRTSFLSLAVQLLQVLSALFLLRGLSVTHSLMAYVISFLASSVATIIPLTIGGIGAREMTFVVMAPYMNIDARSAVAFSLLFFLIVAFSSLPGILFSHRKLNTS